MILVDLVAAAQPAFDVEAATRAYLDTLKGAARAQSDAYFEGGYWLILWGTLVAVLVDWAILRFGLAVRFRRIGERLFSNPAGIAWVTGLLYVLAGSILTFPWTIYTGFVREKRYDLLDQNFGAWAGEQGISLMLSMAIIPLIVIGIYRSIARSPRRWWLWSTGAISIVMLVGIVLSPIYIAPLFNSYSEMEPSPLRTKIESLAHAQGIPADHIYVFDQSKQHKRISANVSGLGPTIRISLNDNLLNRTSEPEILAVMGHEMGHYKLHHVWWIWAILTVLIGLGLFVTSRAVPLMIARWGRSRGIERIGDPASLPFLGICLSLFFLIATPLMNSLIRTTESQADAFGLDAAHQPDGFAMAAMRLSEYRKIEPSPLEEMIFFDHPSGATRVRMAMEWKASHVPDPQIVTPPAGYLQSQ